MKSKTKLNYILYTCNDQSEKRNWENNSIHNSMKYNKMLRNTFNKKMFTLKTIAEKLKKS